MHSRWMLALISLPAAASLCVACGSEKKPVPAPAETSQASRTSVSTATWAPVPENKDLVKVRDGFQSLAPKEFFAKFTTCESNGIPDSYACTGPEVGQFQFFAGDAKAASTTQLLTELRSSRVVEDTGDRIVGWSTLGTTAVITVVDNKRGLTMQQMVSSDKQDPAKRIRELGLVKSSETTSATPSPQPTPAP